MSLENAKPLIIYGNGHMAKMLFHFFKKQFEIAGFTVDEACIQDTTIETLPVVPFSEVQATYPPTDFNMIIAVGYSNMNALRKEKYTQAKAMGYHLASYIHDSVELHDNLVLGDNVIILDHSSIHPYSRIGSGVFITSNCNIGHGCQIDDFCWLNAGVSIGGESTLGQQSFVGINAAVGQGVVVAEENFLGAAALVTRDTAPRDVYLTESSEKFRLDSHAFLRFSAAI